jgi:hypothetical protein
MMDIEKLRGEFELDLLRNGLQESMLRRLKSGKYPNTSLNSRWQGFRAHAALQEAKPEASAVPMSDEPNKYEIILLRLLANLKAMKRRTRHTPGTGQHHAYLLCEDSDFYIQEALDALLAANGEVKNDSK